MSDLQVMTTDGTETLLKAATVEAFKQSLRGQFLRPTEAGYAEVRRIHNGMIDRHPAMIVRCAGVAGLTPGGGHGFLMRSYGLACDNLLAVDLVTANGRLLRLSTTENADLFWGVRGGGGNFGIATAFEYRLYSVGPLLAGLLFYP